MIDIKKFKVNWFVVCLIVLNIILMAFRISVNNMQSFQGNILSVIIFLVLFVTLLILFALKKYDYFALTWLSFYFATPLIKLPSISIGSLGLLNAVFVPLMLIILFNLKSKYYLLVIGLLLLSFFDFINVPLRWFASGIIEFIAPLLFFYFVMKKCKDPNTLIWGSVLISLINLPLAVYEIIAQPAWGSLADWRGVRIFGNLFWHNSYSIYLLPHLLAVYSAMRVKFSKWMLFSFIALLVANMFTLSRAGLLCLVIGVLIFEYLFQSGTKKMIKSMLLVFIFILAIMAYTFLDLQETRIGTGALSERTGIWSSAFPLINNLIIGNGLGSYELYRGEVINSLSPHNYYLNLVFELGLIGLLFVLIFLYLIIKRFYQDLKVKDLRVNGALGLSLIISLMIYSVVGGAAFSQVVALNSWMILGCLIIRHNEETDKKVVTNDKNTIHPS